MTRSPVLPAVLAAFALAAAAAPASAVSIRHTNRAEGDPDAAAAPRTATHGGPAADTAGPRYFDKAHESGTRG